MDSSIVLTDLIDNESQNSWIDHISYHMLNPIYKNIEAKEMHQLTHCLTNLHVR